MRGPSQPLCAGLVLAHLVLYVLLGAREARAEPPIRVGEALLEKVAPADLPGFPGTNAAAALSHFKASCAAPPVPIPATAQGSAEDLAALCSEARGIAPDQAAAFFATRFTPYRVVRRGASAPGFLTGYFEPELTGSAVPSPAYPIAALARPDDLVSFEPGETRPGLDPSLRAARATPGGFEPYPDRAAIEEGALGDRARPVLYLRDAVDLFVLQVQGSGRLRLAEGGATRLLYDGRNGRPYSSIAKRIVAEGHLPLEGLTLARWTSWLRANPEAASRLMRLNASYIFFRRAEIADPSLGPPGAAGVALVPGVSLAVDATLWRYGLPFWLEGRVAGDPAPGRLVIAADTGSAIVGPARGDLYLGTGEEAGVAAGNLRDAVGFVVLLPAPRVTPQP